MVNRYSLADHTVKITLPAGFRIGTTDLGGRSFKVGGPGQNGQDGSFMGSIKVTRKEDTWTTAGDATGSWVHEKSLNRTGSVEMDIRQVSDDVLRFIAIARAFENSQSETQGCLIEVFSGDTRIAQAEDCYIVKIPDQEYGDKSANQNWQWTSGRVTFLHTITWPKESAY